MARTVINVTQTATLDGRDVSVDGAKLDTIENNATADQTAAEIRALVASADNSNVFTDAQVAKLAGIEEEATARGILDRIKLTGAEKGGLYLFDRDLENLTGGSISVPDAGQ